MNYTYRQLQESVERILGAEKIDPRQPVPEQVMTAAQELFRRGAFLGKESHIVRQALNDLKEYGAFQYIDQAQRVRADTAEASSGFFGREREYVKNTLSGLMNRDLRADEPTRFGVILEGFEGVENMSDAALVEALRGYIESEEQLREDRAFADLYADEQESLVAALFGEEANEQESPSP